ncbi:MAG: Tim44-like domain-containing protein [Hydrogenophaga sp.]|jgi:predicted lipid-binding transport protein (Tim44 family)|uniref:Tim44 domain-containing protein n=1 Tax=Hydrogenophaga sp. TaxID=1904254 RepID=UPI00271C2684|nr:Tim44-like domain-containing protein [Hydrogenophaga sp.]MDO9482825.1 Tim44-like domain-containing protein [Hydrogenophaga sp.]MDO9568567.1 Tim44-like domain-containing protein [Hydrogenophaga sp.]MDP2220805.1 Tim44-like domain-containing protein [Hydrogenophaga sp.]MDP3347058.1 Tim44-like domain-containing protein [Hydrogenophaga sp.]MDP3806463.1 Tim44-like domain-containing protein [Hydrogenophaga sp.]
MKKTLSLLAMVFALGLSTVAMDAEARKLGGGKSLGMQRDATPARAPNATPAQTPSATPGAAAAAAPAAAAASSRSKWMGPIAGLAAGLGLMALASHLGFGEAMANMLMIGLLIVAVLAVVGFVMRKRAMAQAGSNGGMAYAGAGAAGGTPQTRAYQSAMPTPAASTGGSMIGSGIGSGIGANAASSNRIPADFDVAGFVRNAKVNFIRLQTANDAGNLDDLRQFTTPEMFAELKMDLSDRGAAEQHTDVVRIDGDVIDVEENADGYVVSVRFTGETREGDNAATEAFDEIWHLTKPRHGSSGWLLAGIQQMQ